MITLPTQWGSPASCSEMLGMDTTRLLSARVMQAHASVSKLGISEVDCIKKILRVTCTSYPFLLLKAELSANAVPASSVISLSAVIVNRNRRTRLWLLIGKQQLVWCHKTLIRMTLSIPLGTRATTPRKRAKLSTTVATMVLYSCQWIDQRRSSRVCRPVTTWRRNRESSIIWCRANSERRWARQCWKISNPSPWRPRQPSTRSFSADCAIISTNRKMKANKKVANYRFPRKLS